LIKNNNKYYIDILKYQFFFEQSINYSETLKKILK